MAERSKAAVLKTVEGSALREFESHSLRQFKIFSLYVLNKDFLNKVLPKVEREVEGFVGCCLC